RTIVVIVRILSSTAFRACVPIRFVATVHGIPRPTDLPEGVQLRQQELWVEARRPRSLGVRLECAGGGGGGVHAEPFPRCPGNRWAGADRQRPVERDRRQQQGKQRRYGRNRDPQREADGDCGFGGAWCPRR